MNKQGLYLKPKFRLIFLFNCFIGTLMIDNLTLMIIFYCLFLLPLFIYSCQIKKHISFLLFGMLPILASFILIYIIILKGTNGDWEFVVTRVLKLMLYTSVLQLALMIPNNYLIYTFKRWGLKGDNLLLALGAFTVWYDVSSRTDKIIIARFARGYVKKRNWFNKAKQFPYLFYPLIIGMIRTSTERAESWQQKKITYNIANIQIENPQFSISFNFIVTFLSTSWVLVGLYNLFH